MPTQILTLNLTPEDANALISALEVSIKANGYASARIAVSIIGELIRQDQEFKTQLQQTAKSVE
jgi:hypothetical protein